MPKSTPKLLAIIIVLQIFTLIGQWTGGPAVSPAQAQVPDAGAQRNEVISQLRITNEKLDKLVTLLSSGNLQVKVSKSDDSKGN